MTWQTNEILQLRYDAIDYYRFVFFATLCSYNFHWYLTPANLDASHRIQWGIGKRRLQLAFTAIGAIGSAYFILPLLQHWLPILGAIVLTFLYSAPKLPQTIFHHLRKIAVGKTLFLTFVWTYVTTVLPALIDGHAPVITTVLLSLHRFAFIYAICILFDWRDKVPDKAAGIRSLITYLDDKHLFQLYYLSLAVAGLAALCMLFFDVSIMVVLTFIVPCFVVGFLKGYAQRHTNDYVYYFLLDGLMMLSGLLHLLLFL
ncbi:UbiA prenyltransferase family protein [Chitinophaga skermanii]|nr:UbiA family prenyltransferase [Chitinophaga skermanii]